MRVHVLYFAILRERLGREGESLELSPGADVRAARAEIAARNPEVAPLLPRVATAVNRAMVSETHLLADGDELALIPPVAGGCNLVARSHPWRDFLPKCSRPSSPPSSRRRTNHS